MIKVKIDIMTEVFVRNILHYSIFPCVPPYQTYCFPLWFGKDIPYVRVLYPQQYRNMTTTAATSCSLR